METKMMNAIDQVNEWMWVGGDPLYASDLQADLELIVREKLVVIDCRSADEDNNDGWASLVNVDRVSGNLHDDGDNDNDIEDFQRIADEIADYVADGRKFLVHCHMGVNRGPSVALMMLVASGMDPEKAFMALRHARPACGVAYGIPAVSAAIMDVISDEDDAMNVIADFTAFFHTYWDEVGHKDVMAAVVACRKNAGLKYDNFDTNAQGIAMIVANKYNEKDES